MAFDAGAVESRLTIDPSQFDRTLDAAEARAEAFEKGKHEIKISAVFDTSSLSRARQQFAQLDNQISKDAMSRLRSNPQGSVLGALNALFSPHQVTGAPSASQAAQQGLLGKVVQVPGAGSAGPSGGQNVVQAVTGSGGAQSNANQRAAQDIATTDRVNTVGLPTNNTLSTEDRVNVTGLPTSGGSITTTDKIEPDVDETSLKAKAAQAGKDAADAADDSMTREAKAKGPGWFSGFLTGIGNLFGSGGAGDQAASDAGTKAADTAADAAKKEAAKKSGGILASLFGGGGGESGGDTSALDKGLLGGIGPGILGTSFKTASLVGLGGAALGGIPALAAGVAPLGLLGAGAGILTAGASQLIGSKNTASNPNAQGPIYQQAQQAGQALQSAIQTAAAGLITPLKNLFNQIPALAKSVTPALSQVFSGSAALIQPVITGLVNAIKEIGPGLSGAFKAAGPLLQPLITGIGQLVGGLMPGLISMLKAAGPAVSVVSGFFASLGSNLGTMFSQFSTVIGPSSVILKALLDVVTGLLPVIGGLAQTMAAALGPAFTAFAGAIEALEPFLVTVGKILAQFAGAVLADLSGGLQLVANILKAVSPAFDQLAGALGQVFNTLESKGGFAQLGNILEGLATPIGNLVKSLVSGLAPAIPPLLSLFTTFVNLVSTVGVQVLTALIPPITNLAQIALGALLKVLPAVIPVVTQFLTAFTADAGSLIASVGTSLLNLATVVLVKLLQAAQPLIPVVLALVSSFTPLLNVLTPVLAGTITAIANALAAVISAIPPGALTAAAVGIGAVVGAMKLWGAATALLSTGIETTLAGAVGGMIGTLKEFTLATEGVTLAEKAQLAAALALDAVNPLAWAVIGAAAIAGVVYALSTLNDGIGANVQALAKQDDAVGYNISGYQKLAAQTQQLGQAQSQAADSIGASAAKNAGQVKQVLTNTGAAYTAAGVQFTALAQNLQSRLSDLSGTFGVSQTQIEKWATAAGISATKFGSAGENVGLLTTQIAGYINKNAAAITATSSLATNVAIFGSDVLSANTQLDAFNAIWNNLVGNLLSKQQAITQSKTSFDNLKQSIDSSGKSSDQTAQSFQAYIQQISSSASALESSGASVSTINSYLQTQISNLESLGPLNKDQQADLAAVKAVQDQLANSTHGLNSEQQALISQFESGLIPDLQQIGADTPAVTSAIGKLTDSIIQTGTGSASTKSDRAQLIADLEQAGLTSQDATKYVDGLQTSISGLKGKVVTIGAETGSAVSAVQSFAAQVASLQNKTVTINAQVIGATSVAQAFANGMATGGLVTAGSGPTSDDVLVRVSKGETVVPAHLTPAFAPAFRAAGIPGFAAGGIPSSGRSYSLGGGGGTAAQSGTRAGGASIDDLAARLDQLHADMREMVSATRAVPAGVGAHVGGALNGAARDASFYSRYPRGGA